MHSVQRSEKRCREMQSELDRLHIAYHNQHNALELQRQTDSEAHHSHQSLACL